MGVPARAGPEFIQRSCCCQAQFVKVNDYICKVNDYIYVVFEGVNVNLTLG
jgi:hypothetical protein